MPLTADDLLWGLYTDSMAHVRHYEIQRTALVGVSVTLGGAVVAVAGWDGRVTASEWPLGALLIAVGLFGFLFSAKQYERATVAAIQAERYRQSLGMRFPDLGITGLRDAACADGARKFRILGRLRIHVFYVLLHLFVAVLGALVLTRALGWL
ncbi:MAG TPA: hypothetical protein VLB76_13970 [Thermoanaerobaculia bacterium]|nr:hypothetical protein [Thermoanaerobaculia bacterium]